MKKLTPYQKRTRTELKKYRAIVAERRTFNKKWRPAMSVELRHYFYGEILLWAASMSKDYQEGVGPLAEILFSRCGRGNTTLDDIQRAMVSR